MLPRIITVTPNPSLDRTLIVPAVRLDEVLRATATRVDPGGKGFNVARALAALGMQSTPIAYLGGDTGAALEAMMAAAGAPVEPIAIAGATRTCYVVSDAAGTHHLKVNEAGPEVSAAEENALFDALEARVRMSDLCVLAGSLPRGVDDDFYEQLVDMLNGRGARPCARRQRPCAGDGAGSAPLPRQTERARSE